MIPVGKDCDCGFPLVWRNGKQWCSVYGRHPAPDQINAYVFRFDRKAPFAGLVLELDAATMPVSRRNHLRAVPAA